jgi:single-strand DNA-binding protein
MALFTGLARIGREVEVRYTTEGEPVASLSLAFSYGKKGDDGKRPTQWVDAALWGKRAESLAPYLLKGGLINATLSDLHIEQFKRSDGTPGVKLAARVLDIELAGGGERSQAPASAPPAPVPSPAPRPAPPKSNTGFDDMDDDIPF